MCPWAAIDPHQNAHLKQARASFTPSAPAKAPASWHRAPERQDADAGLAALQCGRVVGLELQGVSKVHIRLRQRHIRLAKRRLLHLATRQKSCAQSVPGLRSSFQKGRIWMNLASHLHKVAFLLHCRPEWSLQWSLQELSDFGLLSSVAACHSFHTPYLGCA